MKTRFVCSECGHVQSSWLGRCPTCQQFSTFEKEETEKASRKSDTHEVYTVQKAQRLADIEAEQSSLRLTTGIRELDNVLGGGITAGSVTLIGGEPGIGKSTLLLQVCRKATVDSKVLYITGEESAAQIKMRARRLKVSGTHSYLLAQTDAAAAEAAVRDVQPALLIVDSIQTMRLPHLSSLAGSVTQVRECAAFFGALAKELNMAVLLVGHITKDGALAGPRVLEHMVDAVLYFEGEPRGSYRIIRAQKNRFGATSEICVFQMTEQGLTPIDDPSAYMLMGRVADAPGSVVTCTMEGTRPLMMEVQALVGRTNYNNPRRTAIGMDQNRMVMLLAVLEARAGFRAADMDAYVNIAGGIRIDEPSVDAAIIAALYGCRTNRAVAEGCFVIGEVGLTGELRTVSYPERRISEAARQGFTQVVLPASNAQDISVPHGFNVVGVKNITHLLSHLFGG